LFLDISYPPQQTNVAAGEACVRLRSSRNPSDTVFQEDRALRFYDCCAAERRLRQLLQGRVAASPLRSELPHSHKSVALA